MDQHLLGISFYSLFPLNLLPKGFFGSKLIRIGRCVHIYPQLLCAPYPLDIFMDIKKYANVG